MSEFLQKIHQNQNWTLKNTVGRKTKCTITITVLIKDKTILIFSPSKDELVAVSEKSVLRVPDLLDWLVTATSSNLTWDRGTRGVAVKDCQPPSSSSTTICLPDHKLGPGPGLDLSDIEKIRTELGKFVLARLIPSCHSVILWTKLLLIMFNYADNSNCLFTTFKL